MRKCGLSDVAGFAYDAWLWCEPVANYPALTKITNLRVQMCEPRLRMLEKRAECAYSFVAADQSRPIDV